jgi:hypothetical protein
MSDLIGRPFKPKPLSAARLSWAPGLAEAEAAEGSEGALNQDI